MNRARDRVLPIVIGLTLASGWIGAGINRLAGRKQEMESPGTLVWLMMPLGSAMVARALGRSPAPAGWSPALPGAMRWYVAGAAMFPTVSLASLGVGKRLEWVDFASLDRSSLARSTVTGLATSLPKNVFEEAMWRGYLTSELRHRGFEGARLDLMVGAVWGLWHVPYYLFFLPDEDIRRVLDVPRAGFAAVAAATMMAWTPPYSELHRLSGSIWPGVLMHSVEDAFTNAVVLEGHAEIAESRKPILSPVVGVVPSLAYLVIGAAMRRLRG